LRVRHSPLAHQPEWRDKLRAAVRSEVTGARREGVAYAEVGGWAVSNGSRPADCLMLILATFGLSQLLGGAFVMATATVRHASAPILRRLGGSHLQGDGYVVPPYYDPRYKCEMELLRFDTRRPNPKYAGLVQRLSASFPSISVIASRSVSSVPAHSWFARNFDHVMQQPAVAA
jgi:hypothetical protein